MFVHAKVDKFFTESGPPTGQICVWSCDHRYQYDWKLSEAAKNIMRTHTTAVSARMLYRLSQQAVFHPVKYFSIDRVFRNEALDATHLAEFHQIEGLVADYGLTLGDIMGIIEQFFLKCGWYLSSLTMWSNNLVFLTLMQFTGETTYLFLPIATRPFVRSLLNAECGLSSITNWTAA